MQKLLTAVLALSFGVAYAQTPAEKTAKPAGEKPAAAAPGAKATKTKTTTTKTTTKAPAAEKGTTAGEKPAAAEMPEMTPPKPGPETEALKPFSKSLSSTGTVPAGAWAPNSPEMPTKGRATCKWVLNKLWVSCDIKETTGKGKQAMKWEGNWVFGYDVGAKAYRGTMTDNWGMQTAMKGTLEGSKMTWESGEIQMMGHPTKIRITEDATNPKAIQFTSEHEVNGKWVVDETAVHKTRG
jgi:hypothetical protein